MKLVALYSSDGFDLDVLENQIELYNELNCKVIWVNKIVKCDLLVILRCGKNLLNINFNQPTLFIDYSGQDVLNAFSNLKLENKACITSQKNKSHINNVFFGHPYISLKLFSRSIQKIEFNLIHIGNYKPNRLIKKLNMLFIDYINENKVTVYGKNWPIDLFTKGEFKGPLNPEFVSELYSKSVVACGIKHEFQIGRAISGRYWHAPINGCALYVEDEYLVSEIPGIYLYGSELLESRETLQERAINYWSNQNKLQIDLSNSLINKSNFRIHNWLIYIRFRLYGLLYKKYRFLTYGIKKSI